MADAAPGLRPRPKSPSVEIDGGVWRWHVTMAASILHRAAGVGLYVGALIFMAWALALASGGDGYQTFTSLAGSIVGKVALFLLTVCVIYHLCNGVRHLFWDAGFGFAPKTASRTAWLVIALGVLGAVAFWGLLFLAGAL